MIEIVLDTMATPTEVQSIKQAFDEWGLPAEVSFRLVESRSAILPPWVIYVTIASASAFFGGFVAAAGTDAWKGLRDLVGKLFLARKKSGLLAEPSFSN